MEGKSFAGVQYDRALLQLGVLLFLIGLLTGFAVPAAAIPRMALSSHLEGLFNGIVLVVLGLMWHRLVLPAWAERATFALAVYATYANWLATFVSAMTGAAKMMPIAGGGSSGSDAAEAVVAVLLVTLSLAIIGSFLLVLWGLSRSKANVR